MSSRAHLRKRLLPCRKCHPHTGRTQTHTHSVTRVCASYNPLGRLRFDAVPPTHSFVISLLLPPPPDRLVSSSFHRCCCSVLPLSSVFFSRCSSSFLSAPLRPPRLRFCSFSPPFFFRTFPRSGATLLRHSESHSAKSTCALFPRHLRTPASSDIATAVSSVSLLPLRAFLFMSA
jgi:hypothetical protein